MDLSRMPSPNQVMCPNCAHGLTVVPVGTSQCPHCAAWIRFPVWLLVFAFLLSFAVSLVISGILQLKAYAAILWVPIFLICMRFAPTVFPVSFLRIAVVKGPPVKVKWRRNLRLFAASWVACTLFMLAYGFILGWGAYLTGSPDREVREAVDLWSYPLAWANPAFIVRPDKNFVAVFGIVAANSYFYTLALLLAFKVVHGAMRRNRVTQLGISDRNMDDDDDDV